MNLSKHVSEEHADASCSCVSDVMLWFCDVCQSHVEDGSDHVSFELVSGGERESEIETFVWSDARHAVVVVDTLVENVDFSFCLVNDHIIYVAYISFFDFSVDSKCHIWSCTYIKASCLIKPVSQCQLTRNLYVSDSCDDRILAFEISGVDKAFAMVGFL